MTLEWFGCNCCGSLAAVYCLNLYIYSVNLLEMPRNLILHCRYKYGNALCVVHMEPSRHQTPNLSLPWLYLNNPWQDSLQPLWQPLCPAT
eukprot:12705111-Alexandrium_andersonii.AAC.1